MKLDMAYCVNLQVKQASTTARRATIDSLAMTQWIAQASFTAIWHVGGARQCSHPRHQLIRFIPEEDLVPGVSAWK